MKRISGLSNPELKATLKGMPRFFNLGTPVVSDVDRIVTTCNMKVGTYTIATQPDIARNITVSATVVTGADTAGTITVAGYDINGKAISEAIVPVGDATAVGLLAFKTVTSVTGAGWVIATGNDTITIGVGDLLGLPFRITATSEVQMAYLDGTYVAPTVAAGGTFAGSTVDIHSGTYNGSKQAKVIIVEA